jgi:hypothetical protein
LRHLPEAGEAGTKQGYHSGRAAGWGGQQVTRALTERYREHLAGVLSCYDRILITGTLPGACFAEGMTHILYSKGIRIFDYAQFAAPLRDRVRERAAAIAREAEIAIEHIAKRHIRKEEVVAKILAKRGGIPAWCM